MSVKETIEDLFYGVVFLIFVTGLMITEFYWKIRPSRRPKSFGGWFAVAPIGQNEAKAVDDMWDAPLPINRER